MDEYLRIKKKNKYNNKVKKNSYINKFIIKTLVLIVVTLSVLIGLKSSLKFKTIFYEKVYNTHFSFAKVNKLYQDVFGSPIPFKDLLKKESMPVFNEKLSYKTASKYYDGVDLEVDDNLLVPILESGMVVFVGEKENYGNTVIIEQIDGVDVWYGNVTNLNIKLYDYVEKGNILGNADGKNLYLVYKKEGKNLDYSKYLQN